MRTMLDALRVRPAGHNSTRMRYRFNRKNLSWTCWHCHTSKHASHSFLSTSMHVKLDIVHKSKALEPSCQMLLHLQAVFNDRIMFAMLRLPAFAT